MVDVGGKDVTRRVARAGGRIVMHPATHAMIRSAIERGGTEEQEPIRAVVESTGGLDYTARLAEGGFSRLENTANRWPRQRPQACGCEVPGWAPLRLPRQVRQPSSRMPRQCTDR